MLVLKKHLTAHPCDGRKTSENVFAGNDYSHNFPHLLSPSLRVAIEMDDRNFSQWECQPWRCKQLERGHLSVCMGVCLYFAHMTIVVYKQVGNLVLHLYHFCQLCKISFANRFLHLNLYWLENFAGSFNNNLSSVLSVNKSLQCCIMLKQYD